MSRQENAEKKFASKVWQEISTQHEFCRDPKPYENYVALLRKAYHEGYEEGKHSNIQTAIFVGIGFVMILLLILLLILHLLK